MINESESQNMFTLESDVVKAGYKKFALHMEDPNLFIYVISAQLREQLIEDDSFTSQETYKMIWTIQELLVTMKIFDFQTILVNRFTDFQDRFFFMPLYLLLGQTMCGICLSDSVTVRKQLERFKQRQVDLRYTIIEDLLDKNKIRQ